MNEEVKGAGADYPAAEDARPSIEEQADELLQSVAQTVKAAMQVLRSARTLRARAEEEAEAIRAAARRDAAELLARTRTGVQTLLHELEANSNEMTAEPTAVAVTSWSPPRVPARTADDAPATIVGGRGVELGDTAPDGSPGRGSAESPVAALGGRPTTHL